MENRFRQCQEQLASVEEGLENLRGECRRLEDQAQAVREHMAFMCTATVTDLATKALKEAAADERAGPEVTNELTAIQQQMLEATESSRIAGYVALHAMHTVARSAGRTCGAQWGVPSLLSATWWC